MWIFFCYPLFLLFVCFFLLYLPCFFVGFGGLGLPCHLLCCLLLFVYSFFFLNLFLFYLFFFIFIFFYLHGFSGFIFCKFDCSWHFFTSSDRVSPVGGSAREPRFADWYRGVVSYTSDDLGGRVAWLTWNWWNGTEETVDDGLGRRYLGAGRCPVAPPPWLVMAGRSGRWCQLLCFFFFSYLLKIHGYWWLRDLFCLLQGAVKAPRLGSEFHSAFRNIIPVTTPIELRRLLMLPRRKERGETSPKILLNCWVGVVKIPLCSDGLENVVKCSKIE